MDKRMVVENEDGSVSVICPAMEAKLEHETDDEACDRIFAETLARHKQLQDKPTHVVTVDELPAREDRHAWRMKDGKLAVDSKLKR